MITFKDVCCLLAIFVGYGIAGSIDYQDAILLDKIRQEQTRDDCQAPPASAIREPRATSGDLPFARSAPCINGCAPEDGSPCLSSVL